MFDIGILYTYISSTFVIFIQYPSKKKCNKSITINTGCITDCREYEITIPVIS